MTDSTPYVLGSLVVVIVSGLGFNRPSWIRTYANPGSFLAMLALYVASQVAVFVAVSGLIGLVTHGSVGQPAMLGLALTLAMSLLPAYDNLIRGRLMTLSGAPGHCAALAGRIAAADFAPDPKVAQRVRAILANRGIDLEPDWLPPAQPAIELLVRSSILFHELRAWDGEPAFAHFIAEARNDFDELRLRFDRIALKAARSLTTIERLGTIRHHAGALPDPEETSSLELDQAIKKIVFETLFELRQEISDFHEDVCVLLARGALSRGYTDAARRGMLERMGLRLAPAAERPTYYPVLFAGVVVLLGMAAVVAMAPPLPVSDRPHVPFGVVLVLIALVQMAAIALVIEAKGRYGFANAGITGRMPWKFIFLSGLAAVVASMVLNVVTAILFTWSIPGVVDRLAQAAPWFPVSFLTGAGMAALIQDDRWRTQASTAIRRAIDGAVLSILWTAGVVAAFYLTPLFSHNTVPAVSFYVSAVIGMAIGALVPESYRRNRFEEARRIDALASRDVPRPA